MDLLAAFEGKPDDMQLNLGQVKGLSNTRQVFISVRWARLTFFGSLLVLRILVSALIVAQFPGKEIRIWTSFPLPLSFHGLSPARTGQLREVQENYCTKIKARDIRLKLREIDPVIVLEHRRNYVPLSLRPSSTLELV